MVVDLRIRVRTLPICAEGERFSKLRSGDSCYKRAKAIYDVQICVRTRGIETDLFRSVLQHDPTLTISYE